MSIETDIATEAISILEDEISKEIDRVSRMIKDFDASVGKKSVSESRNDMSSIEDGIANINGKMFALRMTLAAALPGSTEKQL